MKKKFACALTIAGSDSGGGAGIQADLKTFAALGVHGTSAITCITAQNPKRVIGIQPVHPDMVRRQLMAVFDQLPPAAVKTGMLYSAQIITVVADFFRHRKRLPLVIDPVMVATSGAVLLKPSGLRALKTQLLPLATLVTPNLPEAEILIGRKLRAVEDLLEAAREIHARFGCAVLIKGGHLHNAPAAVDIFYDGHKSLQLVAPWVRGVSTHGTGCAYSAAIAALLARGYDLPQVIGHAKRHVARAISGSQRVGRHWVLKSFWR
jgi:hydroxymethylpyrimidine/phosphomethylpyrimidine kinase